ncbi:DUF3618 domain-containing protein [Gandjariella thermophila]|uniref:DUF3618 domain-containing protein n=1 Tax=Gandjariella thermophila TaxID=1931992 RepID=A0A4D4J4Z1_9PSEU|nr:DUF3618 domain-containing protein [Gandjariella thermophila]GDY29047.1 hypothetical protein GTS_06800 [Gandjariella thermophila]
MTTHDTRSGQWTLPGGAEPTDDDLRRDIELTREELGATVEELAHRANVKDRAQQAARARVVAVRQTVATPMVRRAVFLLAAARRHPVATVTTGTVCAGLALLLVRQMLRIRQS